MEDALTAPTGAVPYRVSGSRRSFKGVSTDALTVAASLAVVIGAWALVSGLGLVSAEFLPSPAAVLRTITSLMRQPYGTKNLVGNAYITSYRVLAGFGLGLVGGVLVGAVFELLPPVRSVIEPLLSFVRPVPAFAFAGFLLITMGLGESAKITLIFLAVFPAFTIYTFASLHALPPDMEDAARTLGAGGVRLFLRVRLVAALPDLFAGARILLAVSWTAMMGAELVGANSGIGWMIWQGLSTNQNDIIFAGVVVISLVAALMDLCIIALGFIVTGGWRTQMKME